MLQYIFDEFDEALRRKSAYMYFAGIFVLCITANIAVVAFRSVYGTNEGTYAYNIMEYAAWSFIVAYLSCIIIVNTVFGKYPVPQSGDGSTKDLSRTQIYLAKLISSIMLAVVYLVITFVVLVATTALFHINDDRNLDLNAIRVFCEKMFLAMPLFLAGISIGLMFLFCFKDKRKAFAGFYIVTLVIPRLIIFLAGDSFNIPFFKILRTYTISQCFTLIPYPSSPDRNVPLMIALGFIYTALSIVIGIIIYNRQDLKEVQDD
ncbi:MAG: hypothetical protein IKP31_06830 [Lachnospiraceae bacterium]|nr:hypothetical protein [Lachnospiraceae bacterium]